jgi:hypothetical protein
MLNVKAQSSNEIQSSKVKPPVALFAKGGRGRMID